MKNYNKKKANRDLPGGPVVKMLCFQCWGVLIPSLVGELRSHMPWGVAKSLKKKKKANKYGQRI